VLYKKGICRNCNIFIFISEMKKIVMTLKLYTGTT